MTLITSDLGTSNTTIMVDFDKELVMVDARSQGNKAIRAGPLLGSKDKVTIHACVRCPAMSPEG